MTPVHHGHPWRMRNLSLIIQRDQQHNQNVNHSNHEADFVGNGDTDTQESMDDTRRTGNDGMLKANTQRKDIGDQAPVLGVLGDNIITTVAPSSGKDLEEHTGKDITLHCSNHEYPGVPDGPRTDQMIVIPDGDRPPTLQEDVDTETPTTLHQSTHATTTTPGTLCALQGWGMQSTWTRSEV